jgi:hypothetical protein
MKYIDARYDTIRVPEVIDALRAFGDAGTIVEDENGNAIKAIKLFEETLTDQSKKPRLQIYFDREDRDDLQVAARAALRLLEAIQLKTEGPGAIPWPEIDNLSQAIA